MTSMEAIKCYSDLENDIRIFIEEIELAKRNLRNAYSDNEIDMQTRDLAINRLNSLKDTLEYNIEEDEE